MGFAPLLLRPAPFFGSPLWSSPPSPSGVKPHPSFADIRLQPHYPGQSPLADILRLVAPGSDEYLTEQYAFEIGSLLDAWSRSLLASPRGLDALAPLLDPALAASSLTPSTQKTLRTGFGIDCIAREYPPPPAAATPAGRQRFLEQLQSWLGPAQRVETAEFEIFAIRQLSPAPLTLALDLRYDLVLTLPGNARQERVGVWRTQWARDSAQQWKALRWEAGPETLSTVHGPAFLDVTAHALGQIPSYSAQMLHGVDHWRTLIDSAAGIDIYSNNGIAAGDYDNDGLDDLYICQPAGLPNRLYRNRGDGSFEDVTEKAGLDLLDNTACALFADFRNSGLQDLLVVCGSGPLLYLNQGNGTFQLKPNAFQFAQPPQGTFTHAALADYDRDGRLDIYLCTYQYYLGLDQYHYPIPYFDARNGPPNCLFHNQGDGSFVEQTVASGMDADNDRYSFACAWGDLNANGLPDLAVANDFGSSQLYRNQGNGTFKVVSREVHIEDVGAGMSAAWSDYDNDGRQDIYITSMWEAAGQRVSTQPQFHPDASPAIRQLYQRHARGNALYQNQGDGTLSNVAAQANVAMGRWSWSADFWDFDHDGYPDLYVTNGYVSLPGQLDAASFFWRQVVAKSPEDASPSQAYERGWNAINELIRSGASWNSFERNVLFANNRDGTFSEVSGAARLDFLEDSRSFALADIDRDGRLEVILKNRNAPQLRVLHNAMPGLGASIAFRLRGTQSNRDAIGASITLESGSLRQTRYLQAGSGFLAQHSKELFFGLGQSLEPVQATVRWPSGLVQHFQNLPPGHRIQLVEGVATFDAKPFAAPLAAYAQSGPQPTLEPLPDQVETWLLQPLQAPQFSLPDLAGTPQSLNPSKDAATLLHFWQAHAPQCRAQLQQLEQHRKSLDAARLQILAVNLDSPEDLAAARSLAAQDKLSFPILFSTEEIAGVYNILYRHLFDRRRDLPLPCSFLLNREGMIVKIYQGPVAPSHLLEDLHTAPSTEAARLRLALPFPGRLVQGSFQRNDFTYGVALYQHGYFDRAEESFQHAVAARPGDAEGYYNLGTLNLRRNNFPAARQYLEQTLKLRPNYPEAWNNLGMMAAQQGNPSEAIEDFQKSLDLRPNYAVALLNLGNVYRRQSNYPLAEQSFTRALELQPNDPEINFSFGMLYAQQNLPEKATPYLLKAIDLRPAYPEARNNLGVLFIRSHDYAQAEDQFKTCIRLVPSFDQSYINLARLYAMRGDKQNARQVLGDLLELQPNNQAAAQTLQMLQSDR
jgi:Flp pilus assembly protein TadD/peroxiredoxin